LGALSGVVLMIASHVSRANAAIIDLREPLKRG
jgi:hypothetical protein